MAYQTTVHNARSIGSSAAHGSTLQNLKMIAVTLGTVAACIAIFAAAGYVVSQLGSGSYKLATLFIGSILVSNIVSKYALWWINAA